jgi:hypothetical protein
VEKVKGFEYFPKSMDFQVLQVPVGIALSGYPCPGESHSLADCWVIFIKHQMEENRLKLGGTSFNTS